MLNFSILSTIENITIHNNKLYLVGTNPNNKGVIYIFDIPNFKILNYYNNDDLVYNKIYAYRLKQYTYVDEEIYNDSGNVEEPYVAIIFFDNFGNYIQNPTFLALKQYQMVFLNGEPDTLQSINTTGGPLSHFGVVGDGGEYNEVVIDQRIEDNSLFFTLKNNGSVNFSTPLHCNIDLDPKKRNEPNPETNNLTTIHNYNIIYYQVKYNDRDQVGVFKFFNTEKTELQQFIHNDNSYVFVCVDENFKKIESNSDKYFELFFRQNEEDMEKYSKIVDNIRYVYLNVTSPDTIEIYSNDSGNEFYNPNRLIPFRNNLKNDLSKHTNLDSLIEALYNVDYEARIENLLKAQEQ